MKDVPWVRRLGRSEPSKPRRNHVIKRVSKLYSNSLLNQIEEQGVSPALKRAMQFIGKLEMAIFGEEQCPSGGEHLAFLGGENDYFETVKDVSRDCKRVTIHYFLVNPKRENLLQVNVEWYRSADAENDEKRALGRLTFVFLPGGVTSYSWQFDKRYRIEQ